MKFNGVNNKERQRYLVVSGVVICACVRIPCAPRLMRIGVCFERELPALFCVAAHHPSSFSSRGHKLCYFASQFSGRSTNNSTAAMLESSGPPTSVPSSADPPPPPTESLVTSAHAATSPSFELSAQDLTQAFTQALGDSLPHILASLQSHSKDTRASVSHYTSAGSVPSSSTCSDSSAIISPPSSARLSSGNFVVPSFISTYRTLGNSSLTSSSLFGSRGAANGALPNIGQSSSAEFSVGSVRSSAISPGITSSLNRPFVVGPGYSPIPEKLVTKIR